MPKPIDITGQVFVNEVVAVRRMGKDNHRKYLWEFQCKCGNKFVALPHNVRTGHTSSCGCLGHPSQRVNRTFEEQTVFNSFHAMHARCKNPNNNRYQYYGGRGITVCSRWDHYENFRLDMGLKPTIDHTLERIDTNGNYEPSNCKWATQKEQQNNRTNNK